MVSGELLGKPTIYCCPMPCSIINATIAAIVGRIVLLLPMQNGVWKSSPYVRISAAEVSEYGHHFLIKKVG